MIGIEDLKIEQKKKWTLKLYSVFEYVNSIYRLKLSPSIISLESLGNKWGEYNPTLRQIRLNEDLPREYPWETVVEILKHEMAHQVIHEKYSGELAPHGPEFQAVCVSMGLPKWARQSSGELPQKIPTWGANSLGDEQEKLLKKAEKLLALAESSSEHEAALAMERVRQLYVKYNLQQVGSKDDDYVSCRVTRKKHRIDRVESKIFSILIEFFFVNVILIDIYDPLSFETYRGAELLGKLNNVKLAEYVYHFLWNQTEMRSSMFKKTAKEKGSKRAYRIGLVHGFYEKLKDQNKTLERNLKDSGFSGTQVHSLLVLPDRNLETYIAQRFPKLSKGYSSTRAPLDPHSFRAGQADGKKLNLNRGISRTETAFGGFLK